MTRLINVVCCTQGAAPTLAILAIDNAAHGKTEDVITRNFLSKQAKVIRFGKSSVIVTEPDSDDQNSLVLETFGDAIGDAVIGPRTFIYSEKRKGESVDDAAKRTKAMKGLMMDKYRGMRGLDASFKDPSEPKKFSARMTYCQSQTGRLNKENSAKFVEKKAAGDDPEVNALLEKERELNAKYTAEHAVWLARQMTTRVPVLPGRAYDVYRAETRGQAVKEWRQMSPSEKEVWHAKRAVLMEQYLEKVEVYNREAHTRFYPRIKVDHLVPAKRKNTSEKNVKA